MVDPAHVDRVHQAVDVGVRGEHDPDRVGRALLAPPEKLDASHARHPVVGDDDGDLLGLEEAERGLAAVGAQDAELGGEDGLERVEDARLVVDDQHRALVHGLAPPGSYGVTATPSRSPRIS